MSLFKVTDTEEQKATGESSEGKFSRFVALIMILVGIGEDMPLPESASLEIPFGKCLV